ncbi:MAG: hypothetical protein AB7O37_16960 [Vicinamibacteria bacterium]
MSTETSVTTQGPSTRRPGVAAALITVAAAALTVLGGSVPRHDALRLELGGASDGRFLEGPWSRAFRLDIDPPASADDTLSFYCRTAGPGAVLDVPLEGRSPLRIDLRAKAEVRSSATVFSQRQAIGQALFETRRWEVTSIAAGEGLREWRPLRLELALRSVALVAGDHAANPAVMVDWVEISSPGGLRLGAGAALRLALVPIGFAALAWLVGAGWGATAMGAVVGGVLASAGSRVDPLMTDAIASRVLLLALATGVAAWLALRRTRVPLRESGLLVAVTASAVLAHGAIVFFPNHNPPDLETHVGRTLDFSAVPFEYQALLRYGSHLPTASQRAAPATDLFGSTALVPYAPLPYLVFYGLARAGLDLHWLMTVLTTALAALVVVPIFLVARFAWDRFAAWLAVVLYVLDLPVWHHVGRAHVPASFGQALGTMALLLLVLRSGTGTGRRWLPVALLLALAALGYTSQVVLLGLFGIALLLLLAADARDLEAEARRGLALALIVGGTIAFVVYYGHYVPGLMRHSGPMAIEAEPEIFSGRTVLGIFRNEGRQSYRIWALGFTIPFVLGLFAAPLALVRARAQARPVLIAWLAVWGLIALLKDPALFPVTLRWAKEDQFLSPLLALMLAGALAGLRRASLRRLAAGALVALALFLQARDYLLHAATNLW